MSTIIILAAIPIGLWAILAAYGSYRDHNNWLAVIRANKAAEAQWNAAHPEDVAGVTLPA